MNVSHIGWTRDARHDFAEKTAIRNLTSKEQRHLRLLARNTAVEDAGDSYNAQVGIQHVRAAFTLWDLGEDRGDEQ